MPFFIPALAAAFGIKKAHDASVRSRRRREAPLNEASANTDALRKTLLEQYEGLRGQNPTQSATFQAGRGVLNDLLRDQSRRDAGAAAARGLSGSEFEIAQGENRSQLQARALRDLLAQADQSQQAELARTLSALLSTTGMSTDLALNRYAIDKEARARRNAAIAQAVASVLGAASSAAGGA